MQLLTEHKVPRAAVPPPAAERELLTLDDVGLDRQLRALLDGHELQSYLFVDGDAITSLRRLPSDSIDTVITSPPYWGHREYGGIILLAARKPSKSMSPLY